MDASGEPVTDDSFLLLFNAHHEAVRFVLPAPSFAERWALVLHTARVDPFAEERELKAGETVMLEARCVVLLQRLP